jgi:type VI secretion system secreted protein VgrG
MPDDNTPLHSLTIAGLTHEVRVLRFEGFEGISQLFEYEVTIASETPIGLADAVRKDATLTMGTVDQGPEHVVHGVVARVEQGETLPRWTEYRVTVVPWAWLLQQRANTRIFQDKTAPQIVQDVLTGAGYASGSDFALSLQGTYVQREYCVQYRESDWNFVCRLLEEEGISFWFDSSSGGAKLTMFDKVSSLGPIEGDATLKFKPVSGAISKEPGAVVSRLHVSEEVRSGKVTLRDWNFEKPSLDLTEDAAGSKDTDLEVYDYPGGYEVPADGATVSDVRQKEHDGWRTVGRGESECTRFYPGKTFTLAEHPNDSLNTSYLLTRVEHWGAEPFDSIGGADEKSDAHAEYANRFEVVPATAALRPARVTRKPHIHGVQTAIVVGPAGEEIYVDKYGRVKVQFHWDRLGKKDDKSSCWIRVSQPWASAAYGIIFIPRINDEVVVTFLEGDPDRPLIVGSVYHGTNVPPYPLPDEKTKSTIKSNSSKGGGGSNELRFEDKKGSEEVYLHGQKDWTILVENDKNQKVGHDETLEVDHDRTKTVKNDQTATVEHDDKLTVQNDQTIVVQNDKTVTVQNDHTETVQGKQSLTVVKAQTIALNDDQTITVDKKQTVTVTGDVSNTYQAKVTLEVTGDVAETLKAKRTIKVTGDHTETISAKRTLSVSGDSSESIGGKTKIDSTGDLTITVGGATISVKPSGEIKISGVQLTIDASGPLKLHGATVDVKSDGPMTIKAPLINGNADGVNTIKGAMVVLDGQMVNIG